MCFRIQFTTTGLYRLAGVLEGVWLVLAIDRCGLVIGLLSCLVLRWLISVTLAALVDALDRMTVQS